MQSIGPYLYDLYMASFERACLKSWRRELLKHVYGEVLEVGAGTGANIDHYPDQVTRLVLTEPDKHMRANAPSTINSYYYTLSLHDFLLLDSPLPPTPGLLAVPWVSTGWLWCGASCAAASCPEGTRKRDRFPTGN